MGELQRRFLVVILIFISDALTDASTLELLYELVSRATSMIQTYTRRVKEEQNFRQALLTTMKVAKKEQTEIVSETELLSFRFWHSVLKASMTENL